MTAIFGGGTAAAFGRTSDGLDTQVLVGADGKPQSHHASDYRGAYPHDRILNLSFTLTAVANVDTADLAGYQWGIVDISGLTLADTVQIIELIDGTNAAGNLLVRNSAGALVDAAALANGKYSFALASRNLRLTKTADAGADAVVRIALKSAGAPL